MDDCNKKATVWWIDDDHVDPSGPREAERAKLIRQSDAGIDLVAIHPAKFEQFTSELTDRTVPDLLLIDFRLGMRNHSDLPTPYFALDGITLRGTTLGHKFLKNVPAYLVSQVIKDAQTGSSDDHFDWVLSHQQLIEQGGKLLFDDATDYRVLREKYAVTSSSNDRNQTQRELVAVLCELLCVPDASREIVVELAHHEIGNLLRSEAHLDSEQIKLAPSRPRAIAQWVRSTLHKFRGPLIDERSISYMLGTNEQYFQENLAPQLNLEEFKYTGVFSRTATMKFWRLAFLQWLLSQSESIELSPPSNLARSAVEYFNIPKNEWAICRICKKPWPEAIAFDSDDLSVEAEVHWRCSTEATDLECFFGFDVPRSFSQ